MSESKELMDLILSGEIPKIKTARNRIVSLLEVGPNNFYESLLIVAEYAFDQRFKDIDSRVRSYDLAYDFLKLLRKHLHIRSTTDYIYYFNKEYPHRETLMPREVYDIFENLLKLNLVARAKRRSQKIKMLPDVKEYVKKRMKEEGK